MRPSLFLLPLTALLSSCAYEGVVVQKDLQPHPMYLSQGIEGKYTFIVQDKAGVRHRQMVTPEVFERYAIGQYFNDLETGPAGPLEDSKLLKTESMSASRSAMHSTRLASKPSTARGVKTASVRKSKKATLRVAAKPVKRRSSVVAKRKRSKPAKSAVTVAHVAPIAERALPPASFESKLGFVTIARCR